MEEELPEHRRMGVRTVFGAGVFWTGFAEFTRRV
jgi:hypothetical protein